MVLTEEQEILVEELLKHGMEENAIPYMIVGLEKPKYTTAMIKFLSDNPHAKRADILQQVAKMLG